MFGNKKKNLPPRPHIPQIEQITEDLSVSTKNDVAFNFLEKGLFKKYINCKIFAIKSKFFVF